MFSFDFIALFDILSDIASIVEALAVVATYFWYTRKDRK